MKHLEEKRNELSKRMKEIVDNAKSEQRALSDGEMKEFDESEKAIKSIDATIAAEQRATDLTATESVKKNAEEAKKTDEEVRAEEKKDFESYIKGETRAMAIKTNATTGAKSAGDVIPQTVSTDIIKAVVDRSTILSDISIVNSTGKYKQIVEKDKVSAGWTDELAAVTATDADWDVKEIGHEKLGALVKISLELLNQSEINVVDEVVMQMRDSFSDKLEAAVFNGDGSKKPTGLFSGGTSYNLATASTITADEVIEIFYTLKAAFRTGAKWYMNNKTLLAIRKLKDDNEQYLFHEAELTSDFNGMILGKPVSVSDQMEDFEIIFGDIKRGYKANMNPNMQIQMLNEKYIDQGAKGIIGFLFFDGKPVNNQAYIAAKHTAE